MRLEDMKNDIPETPDFIHNMIQNEVAKQLADNKVANLRRRKLWTAPKVAAVAAACALAVSTILSNTIRLNSSKIPSFFNTMSQQKYLLLFDSQA